MTEQKLSLDEMIELAKEFNNKGKWELGTSTKSLCTTELNGIRMFLNAPHEKKKNPDPIYSIHLYVDGRDSKDLIKVEEYFVEKDTEQYTKLEKLYYSINEGFYATRVEEQRQKNAEAPFRSALIEQRTREAVETAKKMIGK